MSLGMRRERLVLEVEIEAFLAFAFFGARE